MASNRSIVDIVRECSASATRPMQGLFGTRDTSVRWQNDVDNEYALVYQPIAAVAFIKGAHPYSLSNRAIGRC
jgi:hypothetical protein